MRYAISLTSIPPRLPLLGPVLAALLAQKPAPEDVFLTLPRRYARFPGPYDLPALPKGVQLLRPVADDGPAAKVLSAAQALKGRDMRLIYCDDDWLYPPDWAAKLLTEASVATTGQSWEVARIGRKGHVCDIAQGFSGVCILPDWLAGPDAIPPKEAWEADDVWLSAVLASQDIPIHQVPDACSGLRLAYHDENGLQNKVIEGRTRDMANRAAAACAEQIFGVWPEL